MSEKSCKKSHRFPPLHAGGSTTGLSVADAWNRATVGNLAGVRPIMMVSDSIVGSDQGARWPAGWSLLAIKSWTCRD